MGYYVNNFYDNPELQENPPTKPDLTKLVRHVLAENPRITRFQINWDEVNNENMPPNGTGMSENSIIQQKGAQQQDRNEMMSHANLA